MRLKGKKVVLLTENLYQELELWVPYYRLKEEGAEVVVVGSGSNRTYTGKYGYPIEVIKKPKRSMSLISMGWSSLEAMHRM